MEITVNGSTRVYEAPLAVSDHAGDRGLDAKQA
jgi:hypothetical protein